MKTNEGHNAFIIFTTNSFRDPLFYGTVIVYLKAINADRRYHFHVISYEQQEYALPKQEEDSFNKNLEQFGISRYPLKWKRGGAFALFQKGKEFLNGFFLAKKLAKKYNCKAIFALANIAGAFSYLISKSAKLKLILFTFEPHSEFMVDCGTWSRSGMKYKLLHHYEKKMGQNADYIMTGTSHMVERLMKEKSPAKVSRVPSCIDQDLFKFDANARMKIRNELKIGDGPVFIYAGKFGDLYYKKEIAALCAAILKQNPNSFFLILTPNDSEEIRKMFHEQNISDAHLHITLAQLSEMPKWISVADFGIVAVPPLPSQKFRSPIKVGEYLACGIPYIVCRGISEDDIWAEKYDVGVVIDSFSADALIPKWKNIERLLNENREEQQKRCRETGIAYRGKQIAINNFTSIFSEIYPEK